MELSLTDEQAEELEELITSALGDLNMEIAGTDNASFRARLNERRDRLTEIAEALRA